MVSNRDGQPRTWPKVYPFWARIPSPLPLYHRGWEQGHLEP